MKVESYTGVTISSVLAKVLELLVLERLNIIWRQIFLIQTRRHTKNLVLIYAILATQEVISKYMSDGIRVFMCLCGRLSILCSTQCC